MYFGLSEWVGVDDVQDGRYLSRFDLQVTRNLSIAGE